MDVGNLATLRLPNLVQFPEYQALMQEFATKRRSCSLGVLAVRNTSSNLYCIEVFVRGSPFFFLEIHMQGYVNSPPES